MLRSLEIHNYRNLKKLTIGQLGRVNLLVGKNNAGKTSVLEAISIYINKGNYGFLLQLLEERGENYIKKAPEGFKRDDVIKTFSALFTDRKPIFSENSGILIGQLDKTLFGELISSEERVVMRFVRYIDVFDEEVEGQPFRRRRIYLDEDQESSESELGLEIKFGRSSTVIPITNLDRMGRNFPVGGLNLSNDVAANFQFVKTKNIDRDINGNLWDRVSLTEGEDEVVNALKIVEKNVDRITFRTERSKERVAVVRLKSSSDVIPLRSMGDGINRILTIILAMVNCEDGYLLIDEYENGLHYSVQEELWRVIFDVSKRLNIQVFATTHSLDSIEAFSNVLNNGKHLEDSGVMIRLENYEGSIEATVYDADEIQATTRVQVDPR